MTTPVGTARVGGAPRPSRRRIMQMRAAAVAAVVAAPAIRPRIDPPRSTWDGKTRWIGHC